MPSATLAPGRAATGLRVVANLQPSFPRKRESSERLVTTVNPGYISSVGCNTLLEPDNRKTLAATQGLLIVTLSAAKGLSTAGGILRYAQNDRAGDYQV